MARSQNDKPPSVLEPVLALGAVLFIFGMLVWLVASNKIVWGSLKPSLWAASMWKWVPLDFTYAQWNAVVGSVTAFAPQPWSVSFLDWFVMVNRAFQPLAAVVMLLFLACLPLLVRNHQKYSRRFKAKQLLKQTAEHFTGVMPVVAIRKQIASNTHPLWRKPVNPDEIFQEYRVPKDVKGWAPAGSPMIRDGKFDRMVARTYFTGFRKESAANGLQVSTMLGRQLVDLVADSRGHRKTVFTDRASAEGKVLFALWAAVAFGGSAGRDEYCNYRDMLNRSAYGSPDGKANLTLAQPLYDKWRKHPDLSRIFAVHHWEHTALFFLLSLAQKKGRYTTAEVLWLRPTNRVMFAAMNTRGRLTPFTEAAATFGQFAFEQACAKMGRVPLMRDLSADGKEQLIPSVFVERAVDGLQLEYERWMDAIDSDEDWWRRKDIWKNANLAVAQHAVTAQASVPVKPMPGADAADTPFDVVSRQQAQASALDDAKELQAAMVAAFGESPELDALLGSGAAGGAKN